MLARNGLPQSLPRQRLSDALFLVLTVGPWVALVWLVWPWQ
jgi:hypothetical protein